MINIETLLALLLFCVPGILYVLKKYIDYFLTNNSNDNLKKLEYQHHRNKTSYDIEIEKLNFIWEKINCLEKINYNMSSDLNGEIKVAYDELDKYIKENKIYINQSVLNKVCIYLRDADPYNYEKNKDTNIISIQNSLEDVVVCIRQRLGLQ